MLHARPSRDGGEQRHPRPGAPDRQQYRVRGEVRRAQPHRHRESGHRDPRICQRPQHALYARRSLAVQKRQLLAVARQLRGECVREIVAIEPGGDEAPYARQHQRGRQHQQPDDEAGGDEPRPQLLGGDELHHEQRDREPQDHPVEQRGHGEMAALNEKCPDGERWPHRHGYGEPDGVGEVDTAREAGGRLLQQAAVDHLRQPPGYAGGDRGERRRRLGDVPRQHRIAIGRLERQPARQRVVADHPQRVDVAARIHAEPARLLRAHVVGRADHLPGPGRAGAATDPGDAEVRHQGAARGGVQQDVVGLHVAVHYAALVRVRQRPRDLAQHPCAFLRRQRSMFADALPQRLAVHVRHREKHHVGALVDGEDGDDVGVGELRRRPGLTEEAPARDRVARLRRVQQLDGDRAIEPQLARQKHHARPAPAEAAFEHVTTGQSAVEHADVGIRFS